MILDAGVLVSIDRGEQRAKAFLTAAVDKGTRLVTTEAVIAQVWRNGSRQARLASFLNSIHVVAPLENGKSVGLVLSRSGTTDVVDAHLVVLAVELGDSVLTSDPIDLTRIANACRSNKPRVFTW